MNELKTAANCKHVTYQITGDMITVTNNTDEYMLFNKHEGIVSEVFIKQVAAKNWIISNILQCDLNNPLKIDIMAEFDQCCLVAPHETQTTKRYSDNNKNQLQINKKFGSKKAADLLKDIYNL